MARPGLSVDVTRQVSSYSIALQQMVGLARVLDVSARAIVLDGPTSILLQDLVTAVSPKTTRAGGAGRRGSERPKRYASEYGFRSGMGCGPNGRFPDML